MSALPPKEDIVQQGPDRFVPVADIAALFDHLIREREFWADVQDLNFDRNV
jgi:hypothetical protein